MELKFSIKGRKTIITYCDIEFEYKTTFIKSLKVSDLLKYLEDELIKKIERKHEEKTT